MTGSQHRPPERAWFRRDALDLARDLLGSVLVRRTPEGTVALPFADIHRAKLILTDELIRAHQGKNMS